MRNDLADPRASPGPCGHDQRLVLTALTGGAERDTLVVDSSRRAEARALKKSEHREAIRSTAGHADALVIYARILPAVPASVPRARHELNDALRRFGMAERRRHDVGLVVSEAVTNATLHAYDGRPPGPVYVEASLAGGRLTLTICDAGRGMRPRRRAGGDDLGVTLMRHLSDQLTITAHGALGGTHIAAIFSAPECSNTSTG